MNHPHIHIEVQPIKGSSNISGVGYHDATKTLEVHMHSGARYRYTNVPQPLFDNFLASDSKGQFFNTRIRGAYDGLRIDKPTATPAPQSASAWPFPSHK